MKIKSSLRAVPVPVLAYGSFVATTKRGKRVLLDNIVAARVLAGGSRARYYIEFLADVILKNGKTKRVGLDYFDAKSQRELIAPLYQVACEDRASAKTK